VIVSFNKINNLTGTKKKNRTDSCNASFKGAPANLYPVKNPNPIKKIIPAVAFVASMIGSLGYLIGGTGLYYDLYVENKLKKSADKNKDKPLNELPNSNKKSKSEDGVKTITTTTKFGKIGVNAAKVAIVATSTSGIACGLGEGIPLMALGEATNIGSASIIETPIGTGIFGIGIASIFAGLALDNTPELKLNNMALMAEKSFSKKAKIITDNMGVVSKEISKAVFEIAKNILHPKWLKDNLLQITPKIVVFREEINKEGKVIVSKMLRHNKNYLMNAASFTLALGGAGIILSSLFNQKKTQKAGLVVEEGGFLFDNLGITKYGLDKLTTGGKPAGISFAIGGVINAISQFLGLDNKDGRALQWLGIAGVFLGFSIDRGKRLKLSLSLEKERGELTQVLREWKFDLSALVKDKAELKKLLKEIKIDSADKPTITNKAFLDLEKKFNSVVKGDKDLEFIQDTAAIQQKLGQIIEPEFASNFKPQKATQYTFEETKNILQTCTEKIFGSPNPTPIPQEIM